MKYKELSVSVILQNGFEQLHSFAGDCLQNELETLFLMTNVQFKSHKVFHYPIGLEVQNLHQNFFPLT